MEVRYNESRGGFLLQSWDFSYSGSFISLPYGHRSSLVGTT